MNNLPPDNQDDAEVDALYRRMAAADPSTPGERVRQAVLTHAARQAAPPAADDAPRRGGYSGRRPRRAWGRPTAFGALAAGILAAFMLGPRYLTSPQVAVPVATEEDAAREPAAPADATGSATAQSRPPPATIQSYGTPPHRDLPVRQRSVPPAADSATSNTVLAAAPAPPAPAAAPRMQSSGSVNTGRTGLDAAPAEFAKSSGAAVAPGSMPAREADDTGALWRAAESGDLAALRELHAQHVNLDAADAAGRTALLIATLRGHTQAVAALLEYGADPNIPDASGESPLAAALAADQSEIIAALKRHGAR